MRGGESGFDSKDFAETLHDIYSKFILKNNLKEEILYNENGTITSRIYGNLAYKLFKHESGCHVVQRVPLNGKGKRHTSIISVGVLPLPPDNTYNLLPESELKIVAKRGSGPGGQNKNKVSSCCVITHQPTGVVVTIDGRDFHQNKKMAIKVITTRVNEQRIQSQNKNYQNLRKSILGNGGRGNKIRTYNFIRKEIIDHRLNKITHDIKSFMNGDLNVLFGE